jgi:hypothetical protein
LDAAADERCEADGTHPWGWDGRTAVLVARRLVAARLGRRRFPRAITDTGEGLAQDELLALGPRLIGATGGSGTRAVARIAQRAGLYIGIDLNDSFDAIAFGAYSDRWINAFTPHRDGPLPAALDYAMLDDLRDVLADHLEPIAAAPRPWGWKEPRSIYLLPFLHRHLPALRFLHVVRDGRDMALSSNQNQLQRHGAVIGLPRDIPDPAVQSITLWNWINGVTAAYGRDNMGGAYLRVRFEDLCDNTVGVTAKVLSFFGLEADAEAVSDEVAVPSSLGRWREADPALVAAMTEAAGRTLAELGYGP